MLRCLMVVYVAVLGSLAFAGNAVTVESVIEDKATSLEEKVIAWRRDFHQHPELSNREFRTAKIVAAHLRKLGMEVRTDIAHTGVIGILRSGNPGPTVALRADMDGLPVTEQVDLPFASKQRATFNGQDVGVMHACGHDAHVAILMGAAEVLASMRTQIDGTVMFIFQPAEEGAPDGEEGGAELMLKEGAFKDPRPDAVFGLHISSKSPLNGIFYRKGGAMASSDVLKITVKGKQTHGASPWHGIDPITVSAQIILGLQTIVSRQMDATMAPAVISIGSIHGGVRSNIIPAKVELVGTIRTLHPSLRPQIHEKIKHTATTIAASAGATADVDINLGYPITFNDHDLTEAMLPTLRKVAGEANVMEAPAVTGAEDFSFFAEEVPGLYFFLGAAKKDVPLAETPAHHTPEFFIEEDALLLGVRAMTHLAWDYLHEVAE